MKVLLIAENWPPRVGGIERYLTNVAAELQKAGDNVTVIAPKSKSYKQKSTSYKLIQRRFFWPLIKPAWLPLFWYAKRLVKRENIDLVVCGKGLFEGLLGYYLKKKLGTAYVVFTYAMEIEQWSQQGNTKRKLEKVLSTADRIIYINKVTRKRLEELGARSAQLLYIPPGVEEKFFATHSENSISEKYGIRKPYILTVARLIPRKGIDNLIEAFSKIDQVKFGNVQLVIAGDGPEQERLQKLAEREFIKPVFLGYVPDEDLPALFREAQLFALTPKNINGDFEGFGIVYLEANAAGIPVIATNCGGAAEAVTHQETGLVVQPESVSEITQALEFLLSHPDEAQRMGQAGQKRARAEFGWKKQVESLRRSLASLY